MPTEQKRKEVLSSGSRALADPRLASVVQDSLLHFEKIRYLLLAWCIMPTHVHVLFAPLQPFTAQRVLSDWKSFTSHSINKALGRRGKFWQLESFCHVIRSSKELYQASDYIRQNPVKDGYVLEPSRWRWSSDGCGHVVAMEYRFVAPSELPFVQMTSRGYLPMLDKPGVTQFATFRVNDAVRRKLSESQTTGGECTRGRERYNG